MKLSFRKTWDYSNDSPDIIPTGPNGEDIEDVTWASVTSDYETERITRLSFEVIVVEDKP